MSNANALTEPDCSPERKPILIPLQGPKGTIPKAPKVLEWSSPEYKGVNVWDADEWLGMRTDDLVVIDCDSEAAVDTWLKRTGYAETWKRKTPRGWHFIYRWTLGSPDRPKVAVFDHIDVRAGRTSQIVFDADGYRDVDSDECSMIDFDPAWLPSRREALSAVGDEWDEMPEGRGNNTMASIAGTLRKQGMSEAMMNSVLHAVNELTMIRDPMPTEMLESIAHSVGRYTPDPDIELTFVDDEVDDDRPLARPLVIRSDEVGDAPPTEWFWKPYFPSGHLVMLDGEEGIGKGVFGIWMTMKVLTGEWGKRAGVLWITTEDSHAELVRRMRAAGYDPAEHPPALLWNLDRHWPNFKTDWKLLKNTIEMYDIAAVVLDPGRSFLGASDFNDEGQVRPVLERLRVVAESTGALILFIHHHNKMSRNGSTVRERVSGSGSYRQVVRHQVTMSEVEGERAFAVAKSNLTETTNTVHLYRITPHPTLDSPIFDLVAPLPEVPNIDEFNKRKTNIQVDATSSVREALRHWESPSLPGARALHRKLGDHVFPLDQITSAYKNLVDSGELINLQNGYRWSDGTPSGAGPPTDVE